MDRRLVMNVEFRSLRPFRRTRPLAAFLPHALRLPGFQNAGLDIGSRLLSLELGILVPQLPNGLFKLRDAIKEFTNNPQQRLDQRRSVLGPNLGKLHPHASQCKKSARVQLRQFSGFLRSYEPRA